MGIRKVPFLFCLCFFVANAITSKPEQAAEDIQSAANYNNYNNPIVASAPAHSPWISGPNRKKYQFHVGQQSWLAAREICLAQNSDLLTIGTQEELDWILTHYKPQLKQFRERQLQIGLLVDNSNADSSTVQNWKWVDSTNLNTTLLKWVYGEPFDHAGGRERCALLNINRRTVEDVDCELSGNPLNFYRFVCERTHMHHLKHEELNNPLWKKLEDILVFFGISSSSFADANNTLIASDPQLEDEDYWDKVNLNSTQASKTVELEGSGEEPKSTDESKTTEWKVDPSEMEMLAKSEKPNENVENEKVEKVENEKVENEKEKVEKTLNDGPPLLSSQNSIPTAAAHGTKLSESPDSDLFANKELEKWDTTDPTPITNDPTLQRTTKYDPLEKLADTLENEMSNHTSVGDRMHQLERIINAVQTMLEEPEKTNSTTPLPTTTAEESIVTEGLEIVQLIEKHNREIVDQNLVDEGAPHEQVETALNLEGDFEHAKVETLAHPEQNSGDFLLLNKQEELVGCGAKNLIGNKQLSTTTTIKPLVNKTEQVDTLLETLRGLLTNSSNDVLSDLLSNGNDPKAVIEKLQKAAQQSPPTTTKSTESQKRVEYEILKSLEELRENESQEFVDLKTGSQELVAIGSGIEPPTERLITLTPVALTARQVLAKNETSSSPTSETLKKSAEAEGFDVNVMLHLPKNDKSTTTQPKISIPESEEEEENSVANAIRAKFQQKVLNAPKEAKDAHLDSNEEGSGLLVDSSEETQSTNTDDNSIFPKPDFSLIKNKKLEAQNKKQVALEKQRVDKAYDELNANYNETSVLERIRESEKARLNSPDGTIDPIQNVNLTEPVALSPADKEVAKTLEEIFDEWATLLGRR